jgi:SNF2 family DNA or RNA helicase
MGLGKTYTTIGLLLNTAATKTLILVPPVLQPQWSEALSKSGIMHRILSAASKKGVEGCWHDVIPAGELKHPRVTLSTYDRATNNISLLEDQTFDRIVCDEGHVLRNGMKTKRFRNLLKIKAQRRWILSGTPVQNRAQDFQNLLKFLKMDDGLRRATPVRKIAEAIMLRRTVAEVRDVVVTMPAEKPLHVVHPVSYPAEGEEEMVFHSLVGKFVLAIEEDAANFILLELFLRIRQFIAHPAIYVEAMKRKFKEKYKRTAWTDTASKQTEFETFLDTTAAQPTIVFTTFKTELELAESGLKKAGYSTWAIAGGMTDAQRDAVIAESRAATEGGTSKVAVLIQIVAGGAGLNLQHCSRVVFLSSHWNPAIVDQAIARAYRMGQTKRVEVHHFMLADNAERNLDRYMARLHGMKREVALGIHDKLFCDSAVEVASVMEELDAVLPEVEEDVGVEDTDE